MATKKPNQIKQPQQNQVVRHQQWEGPLPPPAALDHYETIVSGAAERILSMAEKEQNSRHTNDRASERLIEKEMEQNGNAVLRGQIFGFVSIIACLSLAFVSAYLGFHPAISIAFVSIPLLSAVKALINRQHNKKQ